MRYAPNKKPIICECGHAKSRHNSVMARLVGCRVEVPAERAPKPCPCRRSSEQVERDFGPTPTDDAKGGV